MKFVVTDTRGHLPQDLPLGDVLGEQFVAAEAREVERLRGVAERRGQARRLDLVERGVALRPEVGAPRPVELVNRAVPLGEPAAELVRGGGQKQCALWHPYSLLTCQAASAGWSR